MRRTTLATLLAALLIGGAANAAPTRCEITSKFSCGPTGCKPSQLGVFNLIDLEKETFSRCDRSGCDERPATITMSGIYINVASPGMLAKLSADGSEYLEVVTLGTAALVSFGTCGRR